MDSSVLPKDEIWFLSIHHHISTGLYNEWTRPKNTSNLEMIHIYSLLSKEIAQSGYRPHDYGAEIQYPAGTEMFSLRETVHTCSDTHTSYSEGTKGSFPGIKQTGCEDEHTLPSSAKVTPLALELTFNRWREQNYPTKRAPFFVLEGRILFCTRHLNWIGLQPAQKTSI